MIEANHTHAQFVTKTTESYLLKRDQILPETNQQILTFCEATNLLYVQ